MSSIQKFAAGLAVAATVTFSGASYAANSSATLSVDNAFWLYSGDATGSDLQFVGSGSNWQVPNSFTFDVKPGDYLYVMAYDAGQPHSFQGVFDTPNGALYTNAASWVAANLTTIDFSNPVTPAVITGATFGPIGSDLPATSGPWGNVVGNTQADWIWSTSPGSGDTMVLFRTTNVVAAAVPEPETYAMLLVGLAGLGIFARRRKSAK